LTLSFDAYTPDDFDACCGIFLSNVPPFFTREELPGYQDYLRGNAAGHYWCLRAAPGGPALACGGIWRPSNDEGRLCFGLVRADWHRQGLGTLLLAYRLQKLLEEPGLKSITLDTSQHTAEFFARFGFTVQNSIDDHYAPGLHRRDMTLLVDAQSLDKARRFFDTLRRERAA
jgi:predicted GNAT family N-acyltransferase